MSVINKMLRDLDSRQANTDTLAALGMMRPSGDREKTLGKGTVPVGRGSTGKAVDAKRSSKLFVRVGISGLIVTAAFATAAWWLLPLPTYPGIAGYSEQSAVTAKADDSVERSSYGAVSLAPPTVAGVLLSAASSTASAMSKPKPAKLVARPAVNLASEPALRIPTVPTKLEPQAMSSGGKFTMTLSTDPLRLSKRVAEKVPAASSHGAQPMPSAPQPATVPPTSTKHTLTRELVAQAQVLWGAGDQSGALQLLKGAMQRLESIPDTASHETTSMAMLVREYARYGLASGQTVAVLATLERLEPQLAAVADIWAIRGNASQRLGRHVQAVAAYQQAVALNSNEPRWMLGAAVSMAALGQTERAAEMAEIVRIAGALPADVANYLRQLGVVIRSD